MKFRCNQKQLIKALNIVSKAVSIRTTRPILKCILISADSDSVTFTASDMDITIRHTIDEDIIVDEPGETAVSAKLFLDIIRKLPNDYITIENRDDIFLSITAMNSDFSINTADAEEFPRTVGSDEEGYDIVIDKQLFKDMIHKTTFAASTEEAKGIIIGTLIEFTENSLNMIALDGFRMAVNREPVRNDFEDSIVINASMLNEIYKILSESENEGDIIISPAGNQAEIRIDSTVVNIRLLEGEFIRYRDIIPASFRTTVLVNRNELISSVERAALISSDGKNNLVRVNITNNLLTVTSRSDEGSVKEEMIVEKTGDDIEIGFNSKYLLDSVKALDDEIIKFNFNTSVTPSLITPLEGDSYDFLVLPVRLF